MYPLIRRHALLTAIVACATTVGAATASAQLGPAGTQGIGGSRVTGSASPDSAPAVPPPAAVPGAKARVPAAPASRPVSEMGPTEALFDAINRGDIAAARDALNRGADLNGVNVLGMTPMELSVDLGRNDISFLLLSMRGEDSGRGGRPSARAVQPSGGQKPAPVAMAKPVAAASSKKVAVQKPMASPKLWANDGGTPQPGVGFLGFGSGQASN